MHGYGLADRIGTMPGFAGRKPDVSGVYRNLKGMESRNLVVSTWDTSQSGPAKKTYEISVQGRRCLRRWVRTLAEHREAISALLKTARRAAKSTLGNA
jgi:DNA-binding PadR family transcriptional regulator